MLARIRKSAEEKDQGFTLIELLVVMIIIGILAAIAIPVFLKQREKAQDSAAKADVSTIGKEVATYFVDGNGSPVVSIDAAGRYVMNVAAAAGPPVVTAVVNQDIGKASANNALGAQFVNPATGDWCYTVTNSKGDKAVTGYKYSNRGGLAEGACTSALG
jgi:prepilin-type N-terminal cleavage/methylation domain-containing protein